MTSVSQSVLKEKLAKQQKKINNAQTLDQKISNNYAKHNDEFIFNQFKKTLGKTKATEAAAAYAAADKVGEDADAAAADAIAKFIEENPGIERFFEPATKGGRRRSRRRARKQRRSRKRI